MCLQRDQVELALLPKILIDLYHIRRTFKPYYATDTDNAPNYIVSMIFEADEIQGNLVLSTKLIILITLSLATGKSIKADVLSITPLSEQLEESWVVCEFISRKWNPTLSVEIW